MTVRELIRLLSCINEDCSVVLIDEKGKTEVSHICIFENVDDEVVISIE